MSDAAHSCMYVGRVVHARLRPVTHRLRYRMTWLLLDLDEMAAVAARTHLFSVERKNLFAFYTRDHLAGTIEELRTQIDRLMCQAGIEADGGAIRLLCMPRLLGSVFNPLSVFFIHDRLGLLRALLYEVHNTFGQRHAYLIPSAAGDTGVIHQSCEKEFYVSPFNDLRMTYRFALSRPGDIARVGVTAGDEQGPVLTAHFFGRRREISDQTLMRALLTSPGTAMHVLGAIHWEALKLWRKGLRFHPRPAAPVFAASVHLGGQMQG